MNKIKYKIYLKLAYEISELLSLIIFRRSISNFKKSGNIIKFIFKLIISIIIPLTNLLFRPKILITDFSASKSKNLSFFKIISLLFTIIIFISFFILSYLENIIKSLKFLIYIINNICYI